MMINRIVAVAILFLPVFNDFNLAANNQTPATDGGHRMVQMSEGKFKDWLVRWERNIVSSNPMRYCASEMGESIGWKMMPFLRGFYYGYLATPNPKWVDMLVNCTDLWTRRAVKEADGYLGWPAFDAAGTDIDGLDRFYADSMLGEAMGLGPVMLMAGEIRKTAALKDKYGGKFEDYITLSERIFEKWDTRGAWRETDRGGMVTVELPFWNRS
jgi:hypothetical protein